MTSEPPGGDNPNGDVTAPDDAGHRDSVPAPDAEFDADPDDDELAAAEANLEARRGRVLHERVENLDARVRSINERAEGLNGRLADIKGLHDALAAAVSEELAPGLAQLREVTTSELGELRAAVKELTDEVEKQLNPPVDWPALTAEQAAVQWPILARWVGDVLVPWYELTRADLPDCWALHRPVVMELSWLRSAHVQSYLAHTHPHITGEWHARWRATVLARIKELITEQKCRPGEHMIAKEDSPSRRPASAAAPDGPAAHGTRRVAATPPRFQLAQTQYWWQFYARAFYADQARRSAAEEAAEVNWTPAPPPPDPPATSG